jgi:hypothetical protein
VPTTASEKQANRDGGVKQELQAAARNQRNVHLCGDDVVDDSTVGASASPQWKIAHQEAFQKLSHKEKELVVALFLSVSMLEPASFG